MSVKIGPFGANNREEAEENTKREINKLRAEGEEAKANQLSERLEIRLELTDRMDKNNELWPRQQLKEAAKKQRARYRVAFYRIITEVVQFIIDNELEQEHFFIGITSEEVLALSVEECIDSITVVKSKEYMKINRKEKEVDKKSLKF